MDLLERTIWFASGGSVGFILGYIVRSLRDIKEELDEVDEFVKHHKHDEQGRFEVSFTNLALLLVVLITLYAAILSQLASNRTNDTADKLASVVNCNQVFLGVTLEALTERTAFTADATKSNIDLQSAQAKFFGLLLHKPPPTQTKSETAAQDYFQQLTQFVKINRKALGKVQANPIPTPTAFTNCLQQAR